MSAEWLQELAQALNPQNQPGRLTFIHRFGIKDVEQRLPEMIEAVRASGAQVLWICDPMHGNTETTAGGIKTRRFDNILGKSRRHFASMKRSARRSAECTSNSPAKMSPSASAGPGPQRGRSCARL